MKRATTEKIATLVLGAVIFICGVLALTTDRGDGRTITVMMMCIALLGFAAKAVFTRLKKTK